MTTQSPEEVDLATDWAHCQDQIERFTYRLRAAGQRLQDWPPPPSRYGWWHNPFDRLRYVIRKVRQHCNATAYYLGTDGERRLLAAICSSAFFPGSEDDVDLQRLDDRLDGLEALLSKFCQSQPEPTLGDVARLRADLETLDAVASAWK